MKKLIFPIAVLLLVILFTSCKKDYTCTCDDANAPGSGDRYPITHSTKSAARKVCKDFGDALKSSTGPGWSCNL